VKVSRKIHKISSIKNSSGDWLHEQNAIGNEAVTFYQTLFSSEENADFDDLISTIPPLVTIQQNLALERIPGDEEIKAAVWQLDPTSAPGPDGFDGTFFRSCWDFVAWDVCSAVKEFFLGLPIPHSFSAAQIILLPKVCNPSTFSQYRPICLATFISISKVCTRILANRIAPLLELLISPEQAGFLKGRSIHDQILVANELVHDINRKTRGGTILLSSWIWQRLLIGFLGGFWRWFLLNLAFLPKGFP